MPHLILTEEEINVIKRVKEHTDDFIQLYFRTNSHEPSDVDVGTHLEL